MSRRTPSSKRKATTTSKGKVKRGKKARIRKLPRNSKRGKTRSQSARSPAVRKANKKHPMNSSTRPGEDQTAMIASKPESADLSRELQDQVTGAPRETIESEESPAGTG